MSSSADNAVTCSEGTNVAKNLIDPKEEKDISDEVQINYKDKYRSLKRKLSSLLYVSLCVCVCLHPCMHVYIDVYIYTKFIYYNIKKLYLQKSSNLFFIFNFCSK